MKFLFAEDDPDVTRGVVAIARAAAEKKSCDADSGRDCGREAAVCRYSPTSFIASFSLNLTSCSTISMVGLYRSISASICIRENTSM